MKGMRGKEMERSFGFGWSVISDRERGGGKRERERLRFKCGKSFKS